MVEIPKVKVAAVQTAPVFLDSEKTLAKAISIVKEAANNGAKIIAFPEVFISAYPYWNWITNPVAGSQWFKKLYMNSILADGPEIAQLCEIAKDCDIVIVIGINEIEKHKTGTIYNTNLIIDNHGVVVGKHRKLVPTWAEKLTWTGGDGSSLKVYDTDFGPIGTLACGENTNTLARFSLISQGELIHIANYISLPVAPVDYNMAEAIKIRAAAHSFEGKLFSMVSCSLIEKSTIQMFEKEFPGTQQLFERENSSYTGIIAPNGQQIGDCLIDTEGIIYTEIDLEDCIQPKQMHDILGHYNRFDIFELKVNSRVHKSINFDFENEFETITNV